MIHGLFGQSLIPGKSYQDILASDGTDYDLYVKSKSGVFALLYGGDASTRSKNLSIDKSTAEQAYQRFVEKYPGVGKSRDKTRDRFLTIKQAGGVGTAVSYSAPDRSITSFLGFSRYFDLENEVAKHLFALASKPPEKLRGNPAQLVFRRSGRQQTATGALPTG